MNSQLLFGPMISVFLLALMIPAIEPIYIELGGQPHFYELTSGEYGDNKFQRFDSYIIGNDTCVNETIEFSPHIDLKAEPIIYSNDEKTMSFLLEINVTSEYEKIKGFQISIKPHNSQNQSCIQIHSLSDTNKKFFSLRIKDPSFVSIYHNKYTFYFGEISVHALFQCSNAHGVCLSKSAVPKREVGIKKAAGKENVSITHFTFNDFLLDSIKETCIKRHLNNQDYIFIINALTPRFNRILAKTDTTVDTKFGSSTEQEAENGYFASDVRVESFRRQAYANDLVFKMPSSPRDARKPNSSIIRYFAIFKDPVLGKNRCFNDLYENYCMNNASQCVRCNYVYKGKLFERDSIHVTNGILASDTCYQTDIFAAYDFNNTRITKEFQGQSLNKIRLNQSIYDELTFTRFNRYNLPRICLKLFAASKKAIIDFNDIHKTSQTLGPWNTTYRLGVYLYSAGDKQNSDSYKRKVILNLKQKFEFGLLEQKEIDLDDGSYLFELSQVKNDRCGLKCVDESDVNNNIRCIKCNKMVGRIIINRNSNLKYDICSSDSKTFYNELKLSVNKLLEENKSTNKEYFELMNDLESGLQEDGDFDSGLLPSDFPLDELYTEKHFTKPKSKSISWVIIMACLLGVAVLMGISIWLIHKNLWMSFKLKLTYQKRQILVFLPACVSEQSQQELRNVFEVYKSVMKKTFKNMNIEIVDYKTDVFKRNILLSTSDLILYVLAAKEEVDLFQANTIKIGQNSFQFDYDRIRLVPKYKNKCVYVLFNSKPEKNLPEDHELAIQHASITDQSSLVLKQKNGESLRCLRLPSSNLELLSLMTNARRPPQQNGVKSLCACVRSLSTKVFFHDIHRSILNRLDESTIDYESIRGEFLNFRSNQESWFFEGIQFV